MRKPKTANQIAAQKTNWLIFRLKGVLALCATAPEVITTKAGQQEIREIQRLVKSLIRRLK